MRPTDLKADVYGKEAASVVGGIAILLMVFHHFFGFADFLKDGVTWNTLFAVKGIEVERIPAAFGKICVALFAFNSGYAAWKFRDSYLNYRSIAKRIFSFLICYWIIFAAFMAYGLIVGEELPKGVDLIYNLIGLRTGPWESYINVAFAWYVAYYVTFLALCPLILRVLDMSRLVDLLFVCLLLLFFNCVTLGAFGFIAPIIIGVEGMLVAKYSLFSSLKKLTASAPSVLIGVILLGLVAIRQGALLLDIKLFSKMGGGRCISRAPVYCNDNRIALAI